MGSDRLKEKKKKVVEMRWDLVGEDTNIKEIKRGNGKKESQLVKLEMLSWNHKTGLS
jgi:hypothetical protein